MKERKHFTHLSMTFVCPSSPCRENPLWSTVGLDSWLVNEPNTPIVRQDQCSNILGFVLCPAEHLDKTIFDQQIVDFENDKWDMEATHCRLLFLFYNYNQTIYLDKCNFEHSKISGYMVRQKTVCRYIKTKKKAHKQDWDGTLTKTLN